MRDRILIIDDEPSVTVALKLRLEHAGFEVRHAINGLAGVEAAALEQPHAVVLDIQMPDIDGIDACQRIRRLPGLENTPVIFLSGSRVEHARENTIKAGGAAYFTKPYEPAEIIDAIRTALENARAKQDTTHDAEAVS